MPTPQAIAEMRVVDSLVDPMTGYPFFPHLREWHGQVADYFAGIEAARDGD